MKTSTRWIGLWASSLLIAMAMACSPGPTGPTGPTVGSESHFLSICGMDSDCPPDLACTCGICTIECSDDDTCTARGQSRCVASAELTATCAESANLSEGICVAKCTNDAQCEAITPGTACTADGWCEPQGWDVMGGAGSGGGGVDVDDLEGAVEPSMTMFDEMGGPPGQVSTYLGRIGNRLYFRASHLGPAMVAVYESGRGWHDDPALSAVAADHADRWRFGEGGRILEQGNTSYLYFGDRLFRSEDQGASWQAIESLPTMLRISSFGVDQDSLFVVTAQWSSPSVLWRSIDAGQTWQRLDELSLGQSLAVFPGLLVRYPGLDFSVDQGQTWQPVHVTCRNLALRSWYAFGERVLFCGEDEEREDGEREENALVEFDATEGCTPRYPTGLEAAEVGLLTELLVLDDHLLGVTSTGTLVRISTDLSRAEQITLPEDVRPFPEGGGPDYPRLFDLGDSGIALSTNRGLMASGDDFRTWQSVSPYHHSPGWFMEQGGVVYAPGADGVYGYEDGRWTLSERYSRVRYSGDRFLRRSGRIFVLGGLSLYEFVGDADELTLLWEHPPASQGSGYDAGASISEVLVHEGRLFVAANRRFYHELEEPPEPEEPDDYWSQPMMSDPEFDALVPGAQVIEDHLALESKGGGVFVSDSRGSNFQHFGQGFVDPELGHMPSVAAMAISGDHLYAATSFRGVWRANLDDGRWAPAHEGLPTAADGDRALPVIGLHATETDLFATTADAVYRFDGEAWRLVADGFRRPSTNVGSQEVSLIGVYAIGSRVFAASSDGIYELDLEAGQHRLAWAPPDQLMRYATRLRSGFYVGLASGAIQVSR